MEQEPKPLHKEASVLVRDDVIQINSAAQVRVTMSRCFILLTILVAVHGCAHKETPLRPFESLREHSGTVGVTMRPGEQQDGPLDVSGRGGTSWTAAKWGGLVGFDAGFICFYGFVICSPAGAALGLAGGAIYGGVVPYIAKDTDRELFQSIVAELNPTQLLSDQLTSIASSHGLDLVLLPDLNPVEPDTPSPSSKNVDTFLRIGDILVELQPAEITFTPGRHLRVSAHVELVNRITGVPLDSQAVSDTIGPTTSLENWKARHGDLFRKEAREGISRLAENILFELFLVYRYPERIFQSGLLQTHQRGLRPLKPQEVASLPPGKHLDQSVRDKYSRGFFDFSEPLPHDAMILAQSSERLQPSLEWEPFPGSNVSYEIKIWEGGRLGPERVVYHRADIRSTSHRLETPLDASTLYYWSVRARYSENGRFRITEWGRRALRCSWVGYLFTYGLCNMAFQLEPDQEGFYVFTTPPGDSSDAKDTSGK